MSKRTSPARAVIVFLILLGPIRLPPNGARAQSLEARLDLGFGYDSNITETNDPESSVFTQVECVVSLPLSQMTQSGSLDLFGSARATDYLDTRRSGDLLIGSQWQYDWPSHKIFFTAAGFGKIFRTDILKEDESNTLGLYLSLDWNIDSHSTCFLSQTIAYDDYVHDYLPGIRRSAQPDHMPYATWISTTQAGLSRIVSPRFETSAYLEYRRGDSTIHHESFQGGGLGLECRFFPGPDWEVLLEGHLMRLSYRQSKRRPQRNDTTIRSKLFILRRLKYFELFGSLASTAGHSSWDEETFERIVMQCGISWAF